MCGIVGISSNNSTASLSIYNALTVLQHRGQDAAGMAVINEEGFLNIHKRNGLVRDAFDEPDMIRLQGNVGIGHVRYPTAGTVDISQAQPFYVNSPHGIVLVHNGNLVNTESLRNELHSEDFRHINTKSDSEVLINIFASSLEKNGLKKLNDKSIFKAVAEVHKRVEGAYSVIIAILGYGLIAFRDPNGIRPLIFGFKDSKNHMIASESVALDCLGYKTERDVEPGETIIFKNDGTISNQKYFSSKKFSPCIFEYVYLARPDSTIENINVYESRLSMGRYLAKKIKKDLSKKDLESIDVVIPIPATSRTSALPISIELNKELKEGFVKNRYIGRTFIMPGQKIRKKSVRQKLNTINIEFKNKNVLLVDDSIVRGNTSKQIIKMARQAGAKKVFFASASPPIRFPNVYGIDMPYVKELVAYERTVDEIAEIIGADKLIYQSLEDLISAVKENNIEIDSFDTSCFDGNYVTGGVDSNYLKNLHENR
ncbi:MAG: amidophosphoribosyltransferase [Candidatus Marinimicrobia bacterium]|nr:amidophosphoribosyltransferase [Candidatus Neomarinimicrobiota bacterium]|tara:strand:- start:4085 stop:5536 length:1452 start_codon:yes stop_codon:yes gene_type:complete